MLLPYATLEPVREILLQGFLGEKFGRVPSQLGIVAFAGQFIGQIGCCRCHLEPFDAQAKFFIGKKCC